MLRIPLICLLPLITSTKAAVTDAELLDFMPAQIGFMVECIAAEQALIDGLLYEHRDAPNDLELRQAVDALLKDHKAAVTEMGYVLTRSGQPAQIESVVEHIYPTEFDPAGMSQQLEGPIELATRIATPATPTAFQTRNTGFTIQVTAQLGPDRGLIDIDLNVSGVVHEEDTKIGQGLATVTMPKFFSRQAGTAITARSGEDFLIGVVQPENDSPNRELIFGRATSLQLTTLDDARERWGEREADRPDSGPKNLVTTLEYLEVPLTEIQAWLREPGLTVDSRSWRHALEALIAQGDVRRIATSYVPTRSGQRARVRSGTENIYAVEFDPPEVPQKVQGPIDPGVTLITPTHGTTYEMRPEGLNGEVDPQLGPDQQTVDLSIAPQLIAQDGETRFGQEESAVRLPLFHSSRVSTNVSTLIGNDLLLGVHSNRSTSGKNLGTYTVVLVRCQLK